MGYRFALVYEPDDIDAQAERQGLVNVKLVGEAAGWTGHKVRDVMRSHALPTIWFKGRKYVEQDALNRAIATFGYGENAFERMNRLEFEGRLAEAHEIRCELQHQEDERLRKAGVMPSEELQLERTAELPDPLDVYANKLRGGN